MPPGGGRPGGPVWTLHPTKSPNENFTFGNLYVPYIFPLLFPQVELD